MKVETPQILWHSEGDKGINAALSSVSMLASGIEETSHVLATAGGNPMVHLWKVKLEGEKTKVEYLCSLTRHEGPVNTVAFSPDGLHLATGGDSGALVVWSVPLAKRGNDNGRHYWSTITREQDLYVRIAASSGESVCDLSWSADSKRFVVGSIDHSVVLFEDANYGVGEPGWRTIYRNAMDHTHYVQGVSYDPLGVYITSMSSDRTVRVYPRKSPPKSKRKVLRPNNESVVDATNAVCNMLTDTKVEMGKSKQLKYRKTPLEDGGVSKQYLYADEAMLESFFRRLSFTTDGAFLVTPAALWHKDPSAGKQQGGGSPSYATCLFARHKWDEPCRVLLGLEKPSIAVCPNPMLFQLPEGAADKSKENTHGLPYRSVFAVLTWDSVHVYDTFHTKPLAVIRGLHYCNLVDATWSANGETLIVCSTDGYLSIIRFDGGELGRPYVPAPKQPQQQIAPVTSTSPSSMKSVTQTAMVQLVPQKSLPTPAAPTLPPCEPGPIQVHAPPAKRVKKTTATRITPTLLAPAASPVDPVHASKRPACVVEEEVGEAVDKLSLNSAGGENQPQQPKKKKRIQPVLMAMTTN